MTKVSQCDSIETQAGSVILGWLLVSPRVQAMKARLEKLMDEKQFLQTQLVQIQSMLFSIDYYISEELIQQAGVKEDSSEKM